MGKGNIGRRRFPVLKMFAPAWLPDLTNCFVAGYPYLLLNGFKDLNHDYHWFIKCFLHCSTSFFFFLSSQGSCQCSTASLQLIDVQFEHCVPINVQFEHRVIEHCVPINVQFEHRVPIIHWGYLHNTQLCI